MLLFGLNGLFQREQTKSQLLKEVVRIALGLFVLLFLLLALAAAIGIGLLERMLLGRGAVLTALDFYMDLIVAQILQSGIQAVQMLRE